MQNSSIGGDAEKGRTRMSKFTRTAIVAVSGALALALAGCAAGQGGGDSGEAAGDGTLRWGTITAASTFAQKDTRVPSVQRGVIEP